MLRWGRGRAGQGSWEKTGMTTDADFVDAEFEAELDALRKRYLLGLPARRAALVEAWGQCVDGDAEGAWLALRQVAHRLSGSASCYGLAEVGTVARELDGLLSGRTPCRARHGVERRVARLRSLLELAIRSS